MIVHAASSRSAYDQHNLAVVPLYPLQVHMLFVVFFEGSHQPPFLMICNVITNSENSNCNPNVA
jgi:hypothetical protein